MGSPSGLGRAKTRLRKGVKTGSTRLTRGWEANCGLKCIDRVWYNAIYYIGYSYNPKGVNNDNNQCKLSLHRWYRGQSTIGRRFAFVVLFCRQLPFYDPVERILVA